MKINYKLLRDILIDIQYDSNSEVIKKLEEDDLVEIATGLSDYISTMEIK